MTTSMKFIDWYKSGLPWVWSCAASVAFALLMVLSLFLHIVYQGMGHFWPHAVLQVGVGEKAIAGEVKYGEKTSAARLRQLGVEVPEGVEFLERRLLKIGNREMNGLDFRWVFARDLQDATHPADLMTLERREWGNFYGYLESVKEQGVVVAAGEAARKELDTRLARVAQLAAEIERIERDEIGVVNARLERIRLNRRKLELRHVKDASRYQQLEQQQEEQQQSFQQLQSQLQEKYQAIARDSLTMRVADGRVVEIPMKNVLRYYLPNAMSMAERIGFYLAKVWEFVSDYPREANTEGGVFPAIYGTVLLVFVMTVFVTPFGVVAAVYLREYAKQGPLTRVIRIAVNNLAGVPSIVYGVFGLGFFVYFIGGNIDRLLYPEALPAPTFGTPGLLWSALTLAILTVPVVIVATEEGLARIPSAIREGSLALGATKAETLWHTILPMASPAIMTGMILAIARAAGEVAPLMLVGVVKLAPSLALDGNYPFLHLDRKFMHLGFHIHDVGFQSPNVEAGRPLVYATALLLVLIVLALNLSAIHIRNQLREKTRLLEN